jgi:hypothetical protein
MSITHPDLVTLIVADRRQEQIERAQSRRILRWRTHV